MNILPAAASAVVNFVSDLASSSSDTGNQDFAGALQQASEAQGAYSGSAASAQNVAQDVVQDAYASAQEHQSAAREQTGAQESWSESNQGTGGQNAGGQDANLSSESASQADYAPESAASAEDAQQYTPLAKAPITPHSNNGVHYEVEDLGFTQPELVKLRDSLLKEGLDPDSLSAIEQLASHPHGASLGQLLALMHGSLLQTVSLSDSDRASLQHFADKIDSSGALGKNLLNLLANGRNKEAWDALKSSLAAVSPQDGLVIESGEAALLCKAFGVSQQTSLGVLQQFGQAGSLPLTSEFFTALTLPAEQEILSKAQQGDKLGQALARHLQPLINEARQRAEKERQAAEGADRKSRQSETLIRDKFMDSFREHVAGPDAGGNDTIASEKDEAGRAPGRQQPAPEKTAPEKDEAGRALGRQMPQMPEDPAASQKSTAQKSASGQDASVSGSGADEWRKNLRQSRDAGDWNSKEDRQDARRDSALFSRVEVRTHAQSGAQSAAGFTLPAQPQEASGQSAQSATPAARVREAMQQVDQGSLSRLANGGQRLEVQLAPSDLGSVTLILTSGKGGEISATIRSDKSESAELIARHLDIIRTSLEEQGLKVDKLEVQNQMLSNRDDWQGMDQHNAMREEQERRAHLERLRRLGRHGQDGDDALRARDMQLSPHTAEISGRGLHLVA